MFSKWGEHTGFIKYYRLFDSRYEDTVTSLSRRKTSGLQLKQKLTRCFRGRDFLKDTYSRYIVDN